MSDENPSMMNHVSISVADNGKSLAFYDATLGIIGATRILEHPGAVAYGKQFPEFWVHPEPFDGGKAEVANGVHFAFSASSSEQVNAFYKTAVENGGSGDGDPGPRADYGAPYYGCFVRDPDGHKIEAVYWDESKE